jgi:hypothetical protein
VALVRKVNKMVGEGEQKVQDLSGADQMNEQPKRMYHLSHRKGESVYFIVSCSAWSFFAFALGVGIQTF